MRDFNDFGCDFSTKIVKAVPFFDAPVNLMHARGGRGGDDDEGHTADPKEVHVCLVLVLPTLRLLQPCPSLMSAPIDPAQVKSVHVP